MSLGKKLGIFFFVFITFSSFIYFLFIKKPNLSPSFCFDKSDKELLILKNQSIDIDTFVNSSTLVFFKKIQNKVKIKKVFFSRTKSKILIYLDKNQLDEGVESVLSRFGLKFFKKKGGYRLIDNWKCIFNESSIYFYKGKFSELETKFKSGLYYGDYAIHNLITGRINSYYLKENNLIKSFDNHFNKYFLNKNDIKLFAYYVPYGIDNYIFYEKSYAEQNLTIEPQSSFFKMIKNGFCIFNYNGHEYIIADKSAKIDPYLLLDEENGINEIVPGIRKKYENTFLCSETKALNDFFYLEIYENKLIFAESKEQFDMLLSLIAEKNKISFDCKELRYFFKNQPKEVIYRKFDLLSSISTVANSHSLTDYISLDFKNKKVSQENFAKYSSIKKIVVGKKNTFLFTPDEIIKLQNDIEIERVKYIGTIIGSPELIELKGEDNLFFTTSEKLYFLDQDFKSVKGYPIILKNKPKIPFVFTSLNQEKLIGYSEKKELSICDSEGNIKKRLTLDLNKIKNPISFFVSDNLSAVVYDDQKAYFLDLNREKIINQIDLNFDNTVFLTNNENQAFFYIQNNKLFRNGFDGDLKVCASGKKLFSLKSFFKNDVIGVLSDKNLALFDVMGECVTKVKLPSIKKIDYTIVQNYDHQSYIIILDKLSNLLYIYNFEGHKILQKPIKGSEMVSVTKIGSTIKIYTILNNKLLKYLM